MRNYESSELIKVKAKISRDNANISNKTV